MSDKPPTTTTNTQAPRVADVPRLTLKPKEAARALGIGERLLWTKTNCGEIPSFKVGRRVLYSVKALEQWAAEHSSSGHD